LRRLQREAYTYTYTYAGRVGWLGLGVVEGEVLFAVGEIGRTAEAVFWDARLHGLSRDAGEKSRFPVFTF